MKRLLFLLFSGCIILFYSCGTDVTDSEYVQRIEQERLERDLEFKTAEYSPIKPQDRESFKGLNYYPVDSSYKVTARVTPLDELHIIQINYTNNSFENFIKYAALTFTLQGKEHTIYAYQNPQLIRNPQYHDHLFVPFMDLTNGNETYGAGRYLELRRTDEETMVIDFNTAYNPYCVYNAEYVCPLTPQENFISLPVRAGERNFRK